MFPVALLALVPGFAANISAQKSRPAAVAKPAPSLLASLPQSDAVALVDQRQLLDQAVPKILADNPTKLAEGNAELEKFKTKTGIDPRSFDQVALGVRYRFPGAGGTKTDTLAVARRTFNAG